jgi:hypothetical protein
MRQVACAACEANVPMSEAFSIAERSLCQKCAEQFITERGKGGVKRGEITRQVDPTICAHCSADAGQEAWPTVANLPACTKCESFFRNRPYPTWLKASFAVFMCVAVAAFVYNMRFFLAYVDIVRGNHAMEDGKVEQAIAYRASAADRLPEIPELATIPNLFKAGKLVHDEKDEEALALLAKSPAPKQPNWLEMYHEVELRARMGMAFKRRDYDGFLDFSQQLLKLHPDQAGALGAVASAYACKYAATGDPQFRVQALQYLEQAKKQPGGQDDSVKEFENRFQHRLQTREILTRSQFKERFPNGWKPEGGK